MDENNSGATPPTEQTPTPGQTPIPEIPVVDNTQPTPEPQDSVSEPVVESTPAPESVSSAESAPAPGPTADSSAPTPEIPVTDGTALETSPVTSGDSAPVSGEAAPDTASETPVLSGTPRSLGGTPSGSAEAGGPAAFGSSAITSKPKSKLVPVLVAVILFLGLGGSAAAFYFLNQTKHIDTPDIAADQTPTEEPAETLSRYRLSSNSLSDFDLAFLRLESEGAHASENKVYSPLSIKYALAMLADASAGDSKTQITNLIGDYAPKAYLNSSNRSLANAMFINTTFSDQVKDTYISALTEKYNAEVRLDPFSTPDNLNTWVSDKTLGIITNMFDASTVNPDLSFMLVNALAIDMSWNNKLQCIAQPQGTESNVPCRSYGFRAAHENYSDSVPTEFALVSFNGTENVEAATVAATANRYDIISNLGEEKIRTTVAEEYDKYLAEGLASAQSATYSTPEAKTEAETYWNDLSANKETFLNEYMAALAGNYGFYADSTDFAFSDNETEKIFAKDLQEYDGVTLEYVGIMPKNTSVKSYLSSLSASALSEKLSSLTTPSLEAFKDGVVTKFYATIPFFSFDYSLSLQSDLETLGITDVFNTEKADLSEMMEISEETLAGENRPYIDTAIHKADIDFSNDGIKAAAVTAFGGRGAGGEWDYKWDVPVEEIDLSFDQPFFFLIRDKASGEVWFTGEVNSLPAAS